MIISAIVVKAIIIDSGSLKDKRSAVNSLKQRIKNKFNVSIAEVGGLDRYNYTELGIAGISTENRMLDEMLSKCVDLIISDYRMEVTEVVRIQ